MPTKKAVLIGCNYPGTNAALRGCINDVWGMKAILEEYYGFNPSDVTVMIDIDPRYLKPTGKNIKAKISEMVTEVQDGDICVLHFSGHGTQIPSQNGDEEDAKDEAICPTDMNVICDDDLRLLLKPLEDKPGVKFTFIADCCHSGTLLDHGTVQICGPKLGSPPPPQINMGSLAGALGALGKPDGREWTNRALPFTDLCGMLSEYLGGAPVNASNVRSQMVAVFGEDASARAVLLLQALQAFAESNREASDACSGCACVLQLLVALFSNPGANYAASPGDIAGQHLLGPAGTKPPAEDQLADDVGVLISGCQANETSADACPSGNPHKAFGALSNAIQTVVRAHYQQLPDQPLTYRNLVIGVRELLAKTGFAQNPCLECSDHNADSAFIVH